MKLLMFLLAIIAISSCSLFNKISAPKANPVTLSLAKDADSTINALFSGYSVAGADLSYATNSSTYYAVENTMAQKKSLDSSRKYPTQILAIDQSFIDAVEAARLDHDNDGNISANHISVDGALIKQAGDILVTTEKGFK